MDESQIPYDCAANGAPSLSRNPGPTINDEQRVCENCKHSVVHDLTENSFFGFRANCPYKQLLPPL